MSEQELMEQYPPVSGKSDYETPPLTVTCLEERLFVVATCAAIVGAVAAIICIIMVVIR